METNIRAGPPPDVADAGEAPETKSVDIDISKRGDGLKVFLGWFTGAALSYYPMFRIIYDDQVRQGYRPHTVAESVFLMLFVGLAAAAWPLAWLIIGLVWIGSMPL